MKENTKIKTFGEWLNEEIPNKPQDIKPANYKAADGTVYTYANQTKKDPATGKTMYVMKHKDPTTNLPISMDMDEETFKKLTAGHTQIVPK